MGQQRCHAQKLRDEAPTRPCVLCKMMRETGSAALVTFKEDLLVSLLTQCAALCIGGVLVRGREGLSAMGLPNSE